MWRQQCCAYLIGEFGLMMLEEDTKTPQTNVVERRQSPRLPRDTSFIIVRSSRGELTAAKIKDESLRGIGVWLEFRLGIEESETVQVVSGNAIFPAVVRHIQVSESPDGDEIVAGLEWSTEIPARPVG